MHTDKHFTFLPYITVGAVLAVFINTLQQSAGFVFGFDAFPRILVIICILSGIAASVLINFKNQRTGTAVHVGMKQYNALFGLYIPAILLILWPLFKYLFVFVGTYAYQPYERTMVFMYIWMVLSCIGLVTLPLFMVMRLFIHIPLHGHTNHESIDTTRIVIFLGVGSIIGQAASGWLLTYVGLMPMRIVLGIGCIILTVVYRATLKNHTANSIQKTVSSEWSWYSIVSSVSVLWGFISIVVFSSLLKSILAPTLLERSAFIAALLTAIIAGIIIVQYIQILRRHSITGVLGLVLLGIGVWIAAVSLPRISIHELEYIHKTPAGYFIHSYSIALKTMAFIGIGIGLSLYAALIRFDADAKKSALRINYNSLFVLLIGIGALYVFSGVLMHAQMLRILWYAVLGLSIVYIIAVARRINEKLQGINYALLSGFIITIVFAVVLRGTFPLSALSGSAYRTPDSGYSGWDVLADKVDFAALTPDGFAQLISIDNTTQFILNGTDDVTTGISSRGNVLAAHLPIIFADRPVSMFIMEGGVGITAASASLYRELMTIDVAPLFPGYVDTYQRYTKLLNGDVYKQNAVSVVPLSGRMHLQCTRKHYDIIVNNTPAIPDEHIGVCRTGEFYKLVKRRMTKNGIYAERCMIRDGGVEALVSSVAALRREFKHILVFEILAGTDYIILAAQKKPICDYNRAEKNLSDLFLFSDLERRHIVSLQYLLATFLTDDPEDVFDHDTVHYQINSDGQYLPQRRFLRHPNTTVSIEEQRALYSDVVAVTNYIDHYSATGLDLGMAFMQDMIHKARMLYLDTVQLPETHSHLHRSLLAVKAMSNMQQILEYNPHHPEALKYMAGYYQQYAERNYKQDAVYREYMEKITKLYPEYKRIWVMLADYYVSRTNYTKAFTMLDKALIFNRNWTEDDIIGAYADVLFYAGNYFEAGEKYRTIVAHDPENPRGYYALGRYYMLMEQIEPGNRKEAALAFQTVLKFNPRHPNALAYLGFIALSEGNGDNARRYFQKALRIDPNNAEAAEGMRTLMQRY